MIIKRPALSLNRVKKSSVNHSQTLSRTALLFASALLLIAPGAVNDLVGLALLAGVLVYQKISGAEREKPSSPAVPGSRRNE